MIEDARAQMDRIAALHLERIGARSDDTRSQGDTAPHSKAYESAELRRRLSFIRSLAERAQGLGVKLDVARTASSTLPDPLPDPAISVFGCGSSVSQTHR